MKLEIKWGNGKVKKKIEFYFDLKIIATKGLIPAVGYLIST